MTTEEFQMAVVRAVIDRKVLVLPRHKAQMFVMRCFCGEDATESVLDADFLWPYLWETYFKLHGEEPCELYLDGEPYYLQ